ncbi:MAG: DoxX family protein [Bryobacterales bacterium]|nr:DoxX family protein [Bryobacterales bacterium]
MKRTLWTIQMLLALLFLFAGGVKLSLPIAALTKQTPILPGLFLRFVGVCEVLGATGLIFPGLLRIHEWLTPFAAAGLAGIMIGATTVTLLTGTIAMALFPFGVGLLAGYVAYARWRIRPKPAVKRLSASAG